MKLSVVFELLQYPAFGPISEPPLHIALSVGHSKQLFGVSNDTSEYPVPELHTSHSPVIKNASPTSQDLKLMAKSNTGLD